VSAGGLAFLVILALGAVVLAAKLRFGTRPDASRDNVTLVPGAARDNGELVLGRDTRPVRVRVTTSLLKDSGRVLGEGDTATVPRYVADKWVTYGWAEEVVG
jgi:hypothetical protein